MISSAAIMAPIIPPSVIIVVCGAVTHQSIKALFAGALIPGVLIGLGQVLLVAIMAWRRNFDKIEMRITPRIFAVSLKDAALALLIPVVILGGILGGIVTPTEAAAISINYAFIVGFAIYRNLKIADLYPMLAHTLRMTGMVLFLIAMASILSRVLSKMNVPSFLAERLISNIGNKYLILITVNFFALRRSLDGNERGGHPPGAHAAGDQTQVDVPPIHFGIIMVVNLVIGMVTPPLGICLFAGSALSGVKFEDIVRQIWPFIIIDVVVLGLITFIPAKTFMFQRFKK